MSTRVLVTAIGTMNCTTIISELKNNTEEKFYILGADINPRSCIANSIEVDEYYQFPSVLTNREKYAEYVLGFCQEHSIQVMFCVVDEEVEVLAKHRKDFDRIGVLLCVANTGAIITCHNKDLFADWSEKFIPEYCIKRYKTYSEVKEYDFPVFIKPIEGRASIGCKKIETRSDLDPYADSWNNYVVQECVFGDIIAVDIVSNQKTGQIEIAQRLELLRNNNGCGIAVEIVNNPEVREASLLIAEHLKLNGVINAEFFITKDGPKIIEVNPRLPAGIAYSCMCGLDVVMNALRIARNQECKFNPIRIGTHFAKRYETYETY